MFLTGARDGSSPIPGSLATDSIFPDSDAIVRIRERHLDCAPTAIQTAPPFSTRQSAETQIRRVLALDRVLVGRPAASGPNSGTVLQHEPARSFGRNGEIAAACQRPCR